MASFRIESLSSEHDRARFDCGSEPLNCYLRQFARQHTERDIARTFVLTSGDDRRPKPILGFFTLCLFEIESAVLPELVRKQLPRKVGAVKLARLAVSKPFHKQGLGAQMLMAAFHKFLQTNADFGGIGILVDAKDSEARTYYERFQFEVTEANDLVLFIPAETVRTSLAKAV